MITYFDGTCLFLFLSQRDHGLSDHGNDEGNHHGEEDGGGGGNREGLEDDPRSTPGHSKVLDQIGEIMELMILASRVGLTKKLLRCYVDVQKHLKQLLKDPKSLSSFMHLLRFELYSH